MSSTSWLRSLRGSSVTATACNIRPPMLVKAMIVWLTSYYYHHDRIVWLALNKFYELSYHHIVWYCLEGEGPTQAAFSRHSQRILCFDVCCWKASVQWSWRSSRPTFFSAKSLTKKYASVPRLQRWVRYLISCRCTARNFTSQRVSWSGSQVFWVAGFSVVSVPCCGCNCWIGMDKMWFYPLTCGPYLRQFALYIRNYVYILLSKL